MTSNHQFMIEQLCVLAGSIMEDESVEAVSTVSSDPETREARLERLSRAGAGIAALLSAAEAIARVGGEFLATSD